MKIFATFTLAVTCVALNYVAATERGFLLVAPRVLAQQSPNKLQLHLFDLSGPGEVEIRLLKTNNDTIVFAENNFHIDEGVSKTFLDLEVPEVTDYEAKLQVKGKFKTDEEDYEIFGEDNVNFKTSHSRFIFIQTDKPIYKPGQTVKFRALLVDSSLKPIKENNQVHMWIEEPSGSRVAQWRNVSLGYGITQREFKVSEEPNLGNWKITVSNDGKQEYTTFEVKEYVLPKYEIAIKPPTYVLVTAKTIPVEICGKYTYGKLVDGKLKLNVSLETYSWSHEKFPMLQHEAKIEGCYKYEINVTEVDEDLKYTYRRITIFAEITETGTGVSRNTSISIDRIQNPLSLSFETSSRQYFKPGLPYFSTLKVNNPDNTPAPDELIELCATISRERVLSNWWATRKVKFCRNYTSDENGIVYFTVPPQNTDSVSINLEAKSLNYPTTQDSSQPTIYQPQTSNYLRPWYSPTGSHIQVQDNKDPLKCGKKAEIGVLFTAKAKGTKKFYYEVTNRGKIIQTGDVIVEFDESDDIGKEPCDDDVTLNAKETQIVPEPISDKKEDGENDDDNCKAIRDAKYVPMVGSVNISVDVSAAESPSFHFLIYYIRDDRETVADSQKFTVEKCFNNKVEMEFGDEVKQPGTKTTLTLSSSPNSMCGIKVVDKSISLLDSSDQLTTDRVFNELQKYESGHYYPRNHCQGKEVQPGLEKRFSSQSIIFPPRPWASSSYEDALTAFEDSGFLVISDMILLTRPCKNNQNYEPYGGVAMPSMGIRGGVQQQPAFLYSTTRRRPTYALTTSAGFSAPARQPAVNKVAAMPSTVDDSMNEEYTSTATKSVVDVRTFFPETWLFDLEKADDEGKIIRKEQLPHSITEWLGSAVCINNEDGLGLTSKTAHVKGFQAYFLSFTLPYSMMRGEKLPVVVTAFNYLDKCLAITLEFEQSNGFILLSESNRADVCVCGGKSVSQEFVIQPTALGTLNLTVSGKNAQDSTICGDKETAPVVARDALTNPLLVEAEGFPYEKVVNALFCPKDSEDGTYKKDFAFELPEDVVEDSARGYLSVSGDIMGPTIQNLDNLVRLPTGCGEQNMVTFTPIVHVLDYLKATGKLTESLETKAKGFLASGFQRELKYRHRDGSFSAFGDRDPQGSMWLTAFVLRSFAQADKYTDIDQNIQNQAIKWISSKQNSDGSFPEIGTTLSHGIKGGLNASTPTLTAYVLSSLIIAGQKEENVTDAALAYIASDDDTSDPYKSILFAYTFALAGQEAEAREHLENALSKADSTGEETNWRIKGSSKNSQSLEIAAYAILTLLKLDQPMERSLPIIRGITKARNNNGGFISTQDTVLGLEALSKFAVLLSEHAVDLEVTVSGDSNEKITFDEDDKLLVKKFKTSKVPTELTVEATGTGCGIIQATVLCNTKEAHKEEKFSLDIDATRTSDCSKANIKICTSYIPEGKRSNMAVIEIKMVSGFVANKESLQMLRDSGNVDLKRYDIENNNVVLYFEELKNEKKCFQFEADEIVKVQDVKPATAKVYDYYSTDDQQKATYEIEGSCN